MPLTMKQQNNSIHELIDIMRTLRSPGGCPWDKKQTHSSLKPYLMEECAELMDSIDDENEDAICEELGDILMHIVFHAQIAEEKKHFNFNDVARNVVKKMIRRHPHVFGDIKINDSDAVIELWQQIKKREKKVDSVSSHMDDIPRHFPALFRASQVQKRAAKTGFDWECQEQILNKIDEELMELKKAIKGNDKNSIGEEIGDLLFSIVNLARFIAEPSAEELLAKSTKKFQRRFKYIEQRLLAKGRKPEDSTLAEMDSLWAEAKKTGAC